MKKILLVLAFTLFAMNANAAKFAQIIQFSGVDQESGAVGDIGAYFLVVDTATGTQRNLATSECQVPLNAPGTWKAVIVQCMVTTAAANGITITAADVLWLVNERGDFRRPIFAADWSLAVTKTNIGSTPVNAYVGAAGLGQMVPFQSYSWYRFVTFGSQVGTGVITQSLTDTTNAANTLTTTYSGAAGDYVTDSGWVALPAWATGEELYLKPSVSSSVATDDPTFRQFLLYLK
jgi:hypothetical protein